MVGWRYAGWFLSPTGEGKYFIRQLFYKCNFALVVHSCACLNLFSCPFLLFFLLVLKGRFISSVFTVILSCYSYSPVLPWQSLFWFPSLVHSLRYFLSSCLLFLLAVHPYCSRLLSVYCVIFVLCYFWCSFCLFFLGVSVLAVLFCHSCLMFILAVCSCSPFPLFLFCCPFLQLFFAAHSSRSYLLSISEGFACCFFLLFLLIILSVLVCCPFFLFFFLFLIVVHSYLTILRSVLSILAVLTCCSF